MGIIIFNGNRSIDYGIQVEHPPKYEMPEREYEVIHVPGRSGDIILDKGSYKNVKRPYEISFGSSEKRYSDMASKVSEWLNGPSGYHRLEDTYEPEYYRLAYHSESKEFSNILWHAGRATINFICKPYRYLKIGERSVSFFNSGSILNPTAFESLPIITIHLSGTGTIFIGSYKVQIISNGHNGLITIDSELQDAFYNGLNLNSIISLENGFPKLNPGINSITFSNNITSVEVIPRWRTI